MEKERRKKMALDLKKILPFLPGGNSKSDKLDEAFIYFITFLYGISTAEITPADLLKTAGAAGFGTYSKTAASIYNLGLRWQYGLATATGIIAEQTPAEGFKLFLMKLEQVVRLGDSMKEFLKHERGALVNSYAASYERSMESLKLLLGMFSTLMSTASFMIAAMMIMSMIGGGDAKAIVGVMFAVIADLAAFVYMLYTIFPKDKIVDESGPHLDRYKKLFLPCLGAGVGLGVVLTATSLVSPELAIVAAGAPLILPGYMARKAEGEVRKLNESYPPFIRHLTEIYATVGSLGQALKTVVRSDFGTITTHAKSMLNRVLNKVTMEEVFELFSKDSGNLMITASNKIVATSMIKGAVLTEVGETLAQLAAKFNDLRKKREQVSKAFESTVFILHLLTVAILGFMKGLFEFFSTVFNSLQGIGIGVIQPLSPETMAVVLPTTIIALAAINGTIIKVSQGGLYKTIWFNVGLLLVLGGAVGYGVQIFVHNMFADVLGSNPFGGLASKVP